MVSKMVSKKALMVSKRLPSGGTGLPVVYSRDRRQLGPAAGLAQRTLEVRHAHDRVQTVGRADDVSGAVPHALLATARDDASLLASPAPRRASLPMRDQVER